VAAYTGNGTAQKRKVTLCPTCGQPTHRDPVTKRFTRHPGDLPPPPEVVEEAITTIERSGKPRRRFFGRKR
jgi:hypothetical protein